MDIAVIGLVASLVAFRMIRMTTGRQAAQPLDRRKFLVHLGVYVVLFIYCIGSWAWSAWRTRGASQDLRIAELGQKAEFLCRKERAFEAAEAASRALAMAERRFGTDDRRLVDYVELQARCLEALKKFTEAEKLRQRALTIRVKEYGEGHHEVAKAENNLGVLYFHMDRYDEAEIRYKRALAQTERVLGQVPPVLPVVLDNLAELCEKTGRAEEAKSYRDRAKAYRPGR